jgi:Uma2 family endonuclease
MSENTITSTTHSGEQRLQMSYKEFLAWSNEDVHAEWVDGEAIIFMPPKIRHQQIGGFLYYLLTSFVELFDLGAVVVAPTEMRLVPNKISREPDILFVARNNLSRLKAERLIGPADLIVEIVSDESVSRDRIIKFHEYQQAGVAEYWIIDPRPDHQRAEFYQRTPAGIYSELQPDEQGRVYSALLPGFWLYPDWLWQEPLPNPLTTFFQMRGLPPDTIRALRTQNT